MHSKAVEYGPGEFVEGDLQALESDELLQGLGGGLEGVFARLQVGELIGAAHLVALLGRLQFAACDLGRRLRGDELAPLDAPVVDQGRGAVFELAFVLRRVEAVLLERQARAGRGGAFGAYTEFWPSEAFTADGSVWL